MAIDNYKANPISVAKAYAAYLLKEKPQMIRSNGTELSFVHKEKKSKLISIEDKLDTKDFIEFRLGYFGKAIEKITGSYNNGKKMREMVLNSGYPVHNPDLK